MEKIDYAYLCRHIAKSASSTVRVYEGQKRLCSDSVWDLSPDPVTPCLPALLQAQPRCGIYTTPLFQLYTFFTVGGRYRFILGPSGLTGNNEKALAEFFLELGIAKEQQAGYLHRLRCAPTLTLEKSISQLKMLVYSFNREKPENSEIFFNQKAAEQYSAVANENLEASVRLAYEDEARENVEKAFHFEQMIGELVRGGQVEKLREIYGSLPNLRAGEMARDALRQAKNECICAAAIAARLAIAGGVDCAAALQISDLFIQKVEMLRDAHALHRLQWDLLFDYAARVRTARHGLQNGSALFNRCVKYVSRNLARPIAVEEMARTLNISRAYLSTCFKRETGVTLTQYIQQEKVLEAQRLLRHTSHTILEISDYLAFSSQSHFQTVFKKVSGKTPLEFKKTAGVGTGDSLWRMR